MENNFGMITINIHTEVPKAPKECVQKCTTCAFCHSMCSHRNYSYRDLTEEWVFSHNNNLMECSYE